MQDSSVQETANIDMNKVSPHIPLCAVTLQCHILPTSLSAFKDQQEIHHRAHE